MQTLRLLAPAKVNLYLAVKNKRRDGYHNIETVFEKITLYDRITLKKVKQPGIQLVCQPKSLPADSRNLAFQAAQTLLKEAGCQTGIRITLLKRIPLASGLGGGSSDAASLLLGLNRLLSLNFTRPRLLAIAERLGADVPFFLLPCARAIGRGKGEILTPLKIKRKNWYILVWPKELAISTRQMYQHPRITLTKPPASVKITLCALEKGDLTSLEQYSYNSFERILQKKYPQICEIKKALRSSGAYAALMSGSGPCVFGMTQTRKEAIALSKKIRAKRRNWQVIVARTY